MLMGDLFSLLQLKLPVKVIVFRPEALAFVEFEEGTSARKTVVRFIAVDWSSTARIETLAVAAR